MYEAQFNNDYEAVAASKTAVLTGQTGGGKKGDIIKRLLIIPATTSPGAVTLADGANAAITVFAGGASSVADLKPFWVEIDARSSIGAWTVVTGTNVSIVAVGRFQ